MTHADRGRRTQRVSLSRAPREPVALDAWLCCSTRRTTSRSQRRNSRRERYSSRRAAQFACAGDPLGHKVAIAPIGGRSPSGDTGR